MMQKLNYIRCGDYYIPDIRLPATAREFESHILRQERSKSN